jgi:biotin carboxyl carrier protein
MFKVTVDDGKEKQVEFTKAGIQLDDAVISWDAISTGEHRYHVLMNDRSFVCEIVSVDHNKKTFEIKVNGTMHLVNVRDRFDELLHQLGMDKMSAHKVNDIKAPMPGLVLKIMISEQQMIQEGDSVLILEAMKMENVIKSPGSGKVKSVRVKERDAVEKNQVLIELE